MGLDVQLYAEGLVTDADLERGAAYIEARTDLADNRKGDPCVTRGGWSGPESGTRVDFVTLARYYGEGYERGPWPRIYGAIRLMQSAFPDCTIHYGSDVTDDCPEVTEEFLREVWEHFLGPHGNAYRESFR